MVAQTGSYPKLRPWKPARSAPARSAPFSKILRTSQRPKSLKIKFCQLLELVLHRGASRCTNGAVVYTVVPALRTREYRRFALWLCGVHCRTGASRQGVPALRAAISPVHILYVPKGCYCSVGYSVTATVAGITDIHTYHRGTRTPDSTHKWLQQQMTQPSTGDTAGKLS